MQPVAVEEEVKAEGEREGPSKAVSRRRVSVTFQDHAREEVEEGVVEVTAEVAALSLSLSLGLGLGLGGGEATVADPIVTVTTEGAEVVDEGAGEGAKGKEGAEVEGAETEGAEAEAEAEDLDVIVQTGIGGKALLGRKRDLRLFLESNRMLRVVIELVNSSGIVSEGDHLHAYYFRGELIDA
jgi:hypothetical protein